MQGLVPHPELGMADVCTCRGCTVAYNRAIQDLEDLIQSMEEEGEYCMVIHSCELQDAVAAPKRTHMTGADLLKAVGK